MSNPNEIVPGEMQFLDNSIPTITAGTYQIDVKHDIVEKSHEIDGHYKLSQKFIVQAPRFSLPPNSVQGQFPTPNTATDFHTNLPYIVFRQANLPWARKIGGAGDAPWLALMIFRKDEIVYSKPKGGEANPTLSTVRNVKSEIAKFAKNGIIGPAIDLDALEVAAMPALTASTIDVLYSNFKQLAPRATELPFLAHIRRANSGGDAPDGETGLRSYATLLANRLANPETQELYIAHVVSLEGWADYLTGAATPKPVTDDTKLRLVSLYSWKFNNKTEGVNFRKLIQTMSADTLKLPFSPPATWGKDERKYTTARKETQKKYKEGYVALNYDVRTGEKSFAWYRGPFMPVVPVKIKNLVPQEQDGFYTTHTTSADKAMIYDAATGVFDHSYAVAWELGRMLTLANRPAAIAIWEWKKEGIQKLQVLNRIINDQRRKRRQLLGTEANTSLGALLDGLDWRQVRDDLMDDQAGKYIFMNYLGRGLGRHILGTDEESTPVINVLDPTGLQQHLDTMPGLLSKEEMLAALENGMDPHVLISQKLEAVLNTGHIDKQ